MDKIYVDKLHTTELGKERIKRNIGLDIDDVIEWCKQANLDVNKDCVVRKGKNWYVDAADYILTINAKTHTIITAHRIKRK